MADIINLDERRKARARKDKASQAASNRLKFGRAKVDRQKQEAESASDVRRLDGARRERSSDDEKND
jgi:hypothetical protein